MYPRAISHAIIALYTGNQVFAGLISAGGSGSATFEGAFSLYTVRVITGHLVAPGPAPISRVATQFGRLPCASMAHRSCLPVEDASDFHWHLIPSSPACVWVRARARSRVLPLESFARNRKWPMSQALQTSTGGTLDPTAQAPAAATLVTTTKEQQICG